MQVVKCHMNTLMIHDIRKEYFDLDLSHYRLTFDDGLYSQYYYYPLFSGYKTELIFFISPAFVDSGIARPMFAGEHRSYVKSKTYMYDAFVNGKLDHAMNLEEVRQLAKQSNVRIGAHSYFHDVIITRKHPHKRKPISSWKQKQVLLPEGNAGLDVSIRSKLAFQGYEYRGGTLVQRSKDEWQKYIRYDTELCIDWFTENLGFTPTLYCFPFNEYSDTLLSELQGFGFKEFYGRRGDDIRGILARVDIDALCID